MEWLSNPINKQIVYGNFPDMCLYPAKPFELLPIDFEYKAAPAFEFFRNNPEILFVLFDSWRKQFENIESLKQSGFGFTYIQEVNAVLNTGYSVNLLNLANGIYHEALNLLPVVTKLDKIVWWIIHQYYFSLDFNLEFKDRDKAIAAMYAWISIFTHIEENELLYGYTIEIDKIASTNIIKLFTESWESIDRTCVCAITDEEKKILIELSEKRTALRNKIISDFENQREFADKTKDDWAIFLNVINDLSERERKVISNIIAIDSPRDKKDAINEYFTIIDGIRRGRYTIDNTTFNLVELYESISKRFIFAHQFCTAIADGGTPFILTSAILIPAMNPETFNFLMMAFHLFRLEPSPANAFQFADVALLCLKKNLGENKPKLKSLDDIIAEFYKSVRDFINNNKKTIDRISFKSIQSDTVALETITNTFSNAYAYKENVLQKLESLVYSEECNKAIESFFNGTPQKIGINEMRREIENEEEMQKKSEDEVLARQIVNSLNIIYMFCDALRIVLNSKRPSIRVKDRDYIKYCRIELLKLDDYLVHKVYSGLDENEIGMLEYRERIGVDASSLSEREHNDEIYKNNLFSVVLKDAISRILKNIDSQNIDQIFESKNQIRDEIMRFPDCDEKDQFAEWIDEFSLMVSNTLVKRCKQNGDDYPSLKLDILKNLGDKSNRLPASTIDSLTTAEMLYKRYASEEFANNGFDYSCISALYYQAFEDAYNFLIWKDYSAYLNTLLVDGQSFTSILDACRRGNISNPNARGYLDDYYKTRGFYIDYANSSNPNTTVKQSCMYKSFAILMKNISSTSALVKFCDYFANISGHSDRNDMFIDSTFMQLCQDFTDAIDNSVDSRNNASHGGSPVELEQCKADKRTVLYILEEARLQSMGLIQMLLKLIN